mgnify:FL=1
MSIKKTSLSILISIIFSTSIFIVAIIQFEDFTNYEDQFFSQKFNPETQKILILGSSQIGQVDINVINDYVRNYASKTEIFNLAKIGDLPSERIKTLDEIIAIQPKLVIYGISHRDLGRYEEENRKMNNNESIFHFNIDEKEIEKYTKPRIIVFKAIKKFLNYNQSEKEMAPFYPQNVKSMSIIRSDKFIEKEYETRSKESIGLVDYIQTKSKNEKIKDLVTIIEKLKENNISIILIVLPQDKFHVKLINDEVNNQFNSIINEIQKENKIKVISLYKKYQNMDIWTLPSHIAYDNPNTLVYSKDLADIIIKEIKK